MGEGTYTGQVVFTANNVTTVTVMVTLVIAADIPADADAWSSFACTISGCCPLAARDPHKRAMALPIKRD
jgi:hypothetical protein